MIEPGRGWAYFALFSEIGFVLFVATLGGALGGNWLDLQIGTRPIFIMVGLFAGLGLGARAAYILVKRFLATMD